METVPEHDGTEEDTLVPDDEASVDFAQEELEEMDRALSEVQINNNSLPMWVGPWRSTYNHFQSHKIRYECSKTNIPSKHSKK